VSPNIVFITCHDLGRHLNIYGRETVSSDAIDQLGRDGAIFENSFCTAPQCTPSRAALHTGRHAHSVGVLGLAHAPFNWKLAADQMHIARRLRQVDYETVLLGMQHVTDHQELVDLGFNHVSPVEPAAEIATRANAFLHSARSLEKPFYLEVGFHEPHRPYDWGGAEPEAAKGVGLPPYVPDTPEATQDFAALQGSIRALDLAVGRILHSLSEIGRAEDTLVLFTADHGLAMPRAKCTLYDPGVETALVARWPAGGVSGGRRVTQLISHVDVVPTLMEAIGLPVPGNLHGRSFWPLLQDQPYVANEHLFFEKTYHTAYEPMRAVRSAQYKYILNFEVGPRFDIPDDVRQSPFYPQIVHLMDRSRPHAELYDLRADPNETKNLAGQPELQSIEDALRRRLRQWMQETDDPLLLGPIASPFYQATYQQLRGDPSGRPP
jgi:N-sulfoglucosamine sulfohydrolase